ncbi:pseudouridine synthase [Virgibacillus soli]|uniref:Pseudouridine synthase n=2 Tax=Lederbergia galactosidilytica TaxID=217031 RepID=A0A177ZK10_9BACI|nr:RluA family pseudouridine synthase [Lederbergia galactosidilytica]KRG16030.1 pseudouridine synthase [Virgibacillus soli]OAK67789.1 pseudouridine synthase [Lederbergia galactosidilytica]
MKQHELSWKITAQYKNQEIKAFLQEQGISRRALSAIKFTGGFIRVNGIEQNVRYRLQEYDDLELLFPPEQENEQLVKEPIPLMIMYEDEDLFIVNKPTGMNTIPSRQHPTGSLANAIAYYYEQIKLASTVHIVTRLDRDTSGLVLIAKHRHAHHLLSQMQKKGEIERFYEAFAGGMMEKDIGRIDEPIGRKLDSIIEREVRSDGQKAVTRYKVIQTTSSFSYVKLKLETGRTHQIRVHLAYIGHPLLGDDLYGGKRTLINRQALHCQQIKLTHPITQENLSIQAELPEDMQELLNRESL